MKLLTNVYNPSELDGFNYAFIDITPELAQLILRRRDVFKVLAQEQTDGISDLAAIEYHDLSALFVNGVPEGTPTPNSDEGGVDETTLSLEDLEDFFESTECDRMVITGYGVRWTAYPKHCDRSLTVESDDIDYASIEAALAKEVSTEAA